MTGLSALTDAWQRRWPDCRPQADMLKHAYANRWVRFHSLPDSKRYADTDHEYEILLHRHNQVLKELAGSKPPLLLITCQWGEHEGPDARPANFALVQPAAKFWRALAPDEYSECWSHLFVTELTWSPGALDPVLRTVADDEVGGVIIAPIDLEWLYHPYDGGADVLLPTATLRDQLRDRHPQWLSALPHGL